MDFGHIVLQLHLLALLTSYPTLKVAKTDKFHDRFIAIDNKELYHCGASLKDLGKKCFAINRIENTNFIKSIEKSIKLGDFVMLI